MIALKSPKSSVKQLRATQENPSTDNLDSEDNTIASQDCPKFISCSAPICPLDSSSIGAPYLNGERICFYLSEYSKPHSKIHSEGYICSVLGRKQHKAIASANPVILSLYSAIKYRLKISSTSPSRIMGAKS